MQSDQKERMLKLLRMMRGKEWAMAALSTLLILGQIYFDLKLPDYMSNLTAVIKTPGSTTQVVLQIGAQMLVCTLASALLCIACGLLTAKVAAGFSHAAREKVFAKVSDFGEKEMLDFSVPSLINRTTNDIAQIQMLVAMGQQIMIKAPIMAAWAIVKIINKSWVLSIATAGFVIVLLTMMLAIMGIVIPRVKRVQN